MTVGPDHNAVVVDIHVDADLWAQIASETRVRVEQTPGADAGDIYRAVIDELITLKPTIVVDGEPRGVEDIGVDLEDSGDGQGDDAHPEIPTTEAEIRAAFEDVPRADEPENLPVTRETARAWFPDAVVDDDGPVPDPDDRIVDVEIEVPDWLVATAYYKHRESGAEVSRQAVADTLLNYRQAYEHWVLSDGSDAVEAIVQAIQEADGD